MVGRGQDRSALEASLGRPRPLRRFRGREEALHRGSEVGKGDSADDKKYRGLMPLVGDPLPYGLDANLRSIEAMLTYGLQQNLIPKRMSLEEAFIDPTQPRNS